MGKRSQSEGLVTVYPLRTAYVEAVPHIPQEVTIERADELLRWSPPAFTTDPDHPDRVADAVAEAAGPIEAAQEPPAVPAEG